MFFLVGMRISFDGNIMGISGVNDKISFYAIKGKKILFEVELKEEVAKKVISDLGLENELSLAGKNVQIVINSD